MNTILYMFIHLIMLVSFIIVPRISRQDIEFGVTIPSSAKSDPAVLAIRKRFYLLACIVGVVVIGFQILIKGPETTFMLILMTSLVAYVLVYMIAYNQMKDLKKKAEWTISDQKVHVDMMFRKRKITVSSKWYLSYFFIVLITIGTAVYNFNGLPENIVIQMNAASGEMQLMEKGKALVFLICMQIFVMGLMIFVQHIIKQAKQSLNAENIEASIRSNVNFRYITSVIIFFLGLAIGITMYMSLLFSMGIIKNVSVVVITTFVLTFMPTFVLIVYSVKLGQDGSRLMDVKSDQIQVDDDIYWKFGMFYYNSNDPSVFVGKRVGLGWTVNFARWQSWAMLGILVVIIVATFYFV